MEHIIHSIEPVFDTESRVLILGTMPSPKSREVQFYYGHPQNRFWRVLAGSGGGAGGRGAPVCPGKEGHAAAAPDRPVGRAGRM